MKKLQRIPLSGVFNTRDLGHIAVSGGLHIKPCRLIRSGQLWDLTDQDKEILSKDYHLRAVIDFRSDIERSEKPDPAIAGAQYYENPIMRDMTAGITHDESSEKMTLEDATLSMGPSGIDPAEYMQKMYETIIANEFSQKQYGSFFAHLLEQTEGALLWHCSAGKDRVGIGTAFLLYALGADMDTILEDYMMTGVFLKEETDRLISRLSMRVTNPDALDCIRTCMGVKEQYLLSVFRIMEETSGSILHFLEEKIGLTEEKIVRLKALYLE